MREEKKIKTGENTKESQKQENENIGKVGEILRFPNLILKWLKYVPDNKKLNVICIDNKQLRNLTAKDFDIPGDIMQLYIPRRNGKKGRLKKAAKQMAMMINKETADETNIFRQYTAIIFFAIGECGLFAVNIPEYLEENRTIRIVTIATPFFGTQISDREYVKKRTSFFERKEEYKILSKIYHLPDEELSERSEMLLKVDGEMLKRHHWLNFVSTTEDVSKFAHKVFGADLSDGIVPTDSQDPESENVNRKIYMEVSHEQALLETIRYFNRALYDNALLEPVVHFEG